MFKQDCSFAELYGEEIPLYSSIVMEWIDWSIDAVVMVITTIQCSDGEPYGARMVVMVTGFHHNIVTWKMSQPVVMVTTFYYGTM